jgi:hypothetical protein
VIDSEPGRNAESFGPTARMTSALPARWLAALARERRPCPARKGGRGKGSPCRRSFRRREYRAASRNRPALLRQRIAHAAATAPDPMGRASIRPAPLGLMAPIGAGSSTAARDRWSAASEGPLSHFLTERAPLKPLSNRLTLGKRRRSFRVTTPSRRRHLSTEKCEPSRGDRSSAAMQPSRRERRKRTMPRWRRWIAELRLGIPGARSRAGPPRTDPQATAGSQRHFSLCQSLAIGTASIATRLSSGECRLRVA